MTNRRTPPDPGAPPVNGGGVFARFHRAHLHDYNQVATVYWTVMVILGVAMLSAAIASLAERPADALLQVAAGTACAMLAGLVPVRVPGSKNSLVVGELFIFLLLLLHGTPAAVLAASSEALIGSWRTTRRWSSRIASPALAAVAMTVTGGLFDGAVELIPGHSSKATAGLMLAVLLMSLGYAALNTALLTAVVVLKKNLRPTLAEWFGGFGWTGVAYAASASVSVLIYLTVRQFGPSVLLATLPIIAGLLGALRLYFRVVELNAQAQHERTEAAERMAAQAKEHVNELQRSEQRFHSAFTHAGIGMALVGDDDRVLQVNPALAGLLGWREVDLTGRRIGECFVLADGQDLTIQMGRVRSGEVPSFTMDELRGLHRDGHEIWVAVNGSIFAEAAHGQDRCLILQLLDIGARRRAESRLQHIAWHDNLTALPNRGRFIETLSELAAAGETFALMFLDFDRFKLINDGLGHNVGDEFLRRVAERIRSHVRPTDMVARLGGDEFAVLMRNIADAEPAVLLAERLLTALGEPMQVLDHELTTSASIGIRVVKNGKREPAELLRDADTAMYKAKAAGKARWQLFDESMHAEVSERLKLEGDLRRAIELDQIEVAFQPMVDLRSGHVLGIEALARWTHPSLGEIGPARFVPIAAEAGLVTQLTQRVLARACTAIAGFAAAGEAPLSIHVNVTALDLCQSSFASQVARLLARLGLKPGQLVLELTESMLMERLEGALSTMNDLRDLGVGLCVDDFGTGYSSLAYLSSLPITSLKIDARFVHQLSTGRDSTEIVRAIVQLGDALGKQVVAEGIEQPDQIDHLLSLGCRRGQGFLLGRPQPAAAIARLLSGDGATRGEPAAATNDPARQPDDALIGR